MATLMMFAIALYDWRGSGERDHVRLAAVFWDALADAPPEVKLVRDYLLLSPNSWPDMGIVYAADAKLFAERVDRHSPLADRLTNDLHHLIMTGLRDK